MFWIDHVGLVVRDMQESIAFYTKLFGDGPIDRVEWRGEHAAQVARMLDRLQRIAQVGLDSAGLRRGWATLGHDGSSRAPV